ncbi:hypothetical protein A4X06_0g8349 [Tilletia controversa]|uniref:Uncharacterized protein n=1 Tax=Tilletia controversa TaxID=13291 RepID=A0A8X7ML55_9BASI|nr:hypothetical protein A4X06_0g8349 [Tilletia controversa]
MSEHAATLDQLQQLHKQDAQLLLRRSLQHQLRHLQRFLPSEGLDDAWALVDSALHHSLRLLRDGAAQPRRGTHDSVLFQLPLRLSPELTRSWGFADSALLRRRAPPEAERGAHF